MPDVIRKRSFPVLPRCCAIGAFALASMAVPALAETDDVDVFGTVHNGQVDEKPTEQNVAIEVRFGSYLPELPNVLNTTPSFADELGRRRRVLLGIEADWQALRIPRILSLGPGAGIGYTRLSGSGKFETYKYDAVLKVMPQWLVAVLRVDILQQRWKIPLVLSGKLGAARASWWSTNTPAYNNTVTQKDSGSAQGLAWALGAMLDLGILDPERARHLDQIAGVNHMYVFWEWYQFKLDDFGKAPNQLGDTTWTLGWAIDM